MPVGKASEPRGLHEPCRLDLHQSVPTSTKPWSKLKVCLRGRLETALYHIHLRTCLPKVKDREGGSYEAARASTCLGGHLLSA